MGEPDQLPDIERSHGELIVILCDCQIFLQLISLPKNIIYISWRQCLLNFVYTHHDWMFMVDGFSGFTMQSTVRQAPSNSTEGLGEQKLLLETMVQQEKWSILSWKQQMKFLCPHSKILSNDSIKSNVKEKKVIFRVRTLGWL